MASGMLPRSPRNHAGRRHASAAFQRVTGSASCRGNHSEPARPLRSTAASNQVTTPVYAASGYAATATRGSHGHQCIQAVHAAFRADQTGADLQGFCATRAPRLSHTSGPLAARAFPAVARPRVEQVRTVSAPSFDLPERQHRRQHPVLHHHAGAVAAGEALHRPQRRRIGVARSRGTHDEQGLAFQTPSRLRSASARSTRCSTVGAVYSPM